jgi:hypothetical protein
MNQMEITTALMGVSFALLLAALAVVPNLIRVFRELRQERQGGQRESSRAPANFPPPVPFNFPPMSIQVLSTENREQLRGKRRPAQLAVSKLLEAYPAPVPFNYAPMPSPRAQDQ